MNFVGVAGHHRFAANANIDHITNLVRKISRDTLWCQQTNKQIYHVA